MNLKTNRSRAIGVAVLAAGCSGVAQGAELGLDVRNAQARELAWETEGLSSYLSHGGSVFAPEVFGFLQTRYNFNYADEPVSTRNVTNGFLNERVRLGARGKVHERMGYFLSGEFSADGGGETLQDGFAWFAIDDHWDLRIGQFKAPFSREFQVGTTKQLAVERSGVHSYFTLGRTQGVMLTYQGDRVRAHISFNDGFRAANTRTFSPFEADYAITGRAEYLGAGDWTQFEDFTSWRGGDRGWLAGVGAHWQEGGDTTGTFDTTLLAVTGDVSFEFGGSNLFAAVNWQQYDDGISDGDDLGVVVQGGFFVSDAVELYGRYDVFIPDADRPGDNTFNTFTIGANYYLLQESHAAKLSADFSYMPDSEVDSSIDSSDRYGIIGADGTQVNARLQLQVMF